MQNIKLLDCTLRDGGYVNNWEFGQPVITRIVQKVLLSGVDVIELGYLSTKDAGDPNVARYSSISDISRAYTANKMACQDYAVMINYGEYPTEMLPVAEIDSPILRVAFHKNNLEGAFEYFERLKELGYRFFIQPMGVLNYSDEEFVQLVQMANATSAEAFYIVDSFGVIEMKDFRRLIFVADNILRKDIALGYHAHNNLQQAYSNAKYMVEQNLEHNLIIDASVFGMGRGAGNLNLELFAKYLNQSFGKNYNIEPILEVFDECLKPIFANKFWGYSLPFYLSSIHNCHPNYASFFAEKNTLSVKSMHEILGMISVEDKVSFSVEKAAAYYKRYQENYIDDKKDVAEIAKCVASREILILASGSTLVTHQNEIKQFISEHNPVVIGVNRASDLYQYRYLFTSNEKRLTDGKPANVQTFIKTSNLHKILPDTLQVNYASYLVNNDTISDNPTLMLLNLLVSIGVSSVTIAGFDGFSANPDENYFMKGLSMGSSLASKITKNQLIADELKNIAKRIKVSFLTPSLYL